MKERQWRVDSLGLWFCCILCVEDILNGCFGLVHLHRVIFIVAIFSVFVFSVSYLDYTDMLYCNILVNKIVYIYS